MLHYSQVSAVDNCDRRSGVFGTSRECAAKEIWRRRARDLRHSLRNMIDREQSDITIEVNYDGLRSIGTYESINATASKAVSLSNQLIRGEAMLASIASLLAQVAL